MLLHVVELFIDGLKWSFFQHMTLKYDGVVLELQV